MQYLWPSSESCDAALLTEIFDERGSLDSERSESSADLFDDGLARGVVAEGPLPFFVEADAAVGPDLVRRRANAGHEITACIQVLITYIKDAVIVGSRDQMPANDLAAAVFGPDDIARLVIVKDGFGADLAGRRVLNGAKFCRRS